MWFVAVIQSPAGDYWTEWARTDTRELAARIIERRLEIERVFRHDTTLGLAEIVYMREVPSYVQS